MANGTFGGNKPAKPQRTPLQALFYWAVVLGTSMVGTEMSDFLDRGPGHGSAADGVGYAWGALILTSPCASIPVPVQPTV